MKLESTQELFKDQVWDIVRFEVTGQVTPQVIRKAIGQAGDRVNDEVWDQVFLAVYRDLKLQNNNRHQR